MNSIKSFLASIAILCVSILYAEDNYTYIKQQVHSSAIQALQCYMIVKNTLNTICAFI